MMKDLSLSKVYQLIEPGAVVLLTTARRGHANVMAMSWHMMAEFVPPLIRNSGSGTGSSANLPAFVVCRGSQSAGADKVSSTSRQV
jgi:flavin reductase (DIM6/NTAB) family NADH-FMN oxidoreductase RutF